MNSTEGSKGCAVSDASYVFTSDLCSLTCLQGPWPLVSPWPLLWWPTLHGFCLVTTMVTHLHRHNLTALHLTCAPPASRLPPYSLPVATGAQDTADQHGAHTCTTQKCGGIHVPWGKTLTSDRRESTTWKFLISCPVLSCLEMRSFIWSLWGKPMGWSNVLPTLYLSLFLASLLHSLMPDTLELYSPVKYKHVSFWFKLCFLWDLAYETVYQISGSTTEKIIRK